MSVRVIEALWNRIQARDWAGVEELVAPDAVVEWPVTAERIVGRDNFVAVQREYPEGWTIHVVRIVAQGDEVVSEVEVPHVELGMFAAASFWTVRDGRVVRGREYWVTPGSETPPEWRSRFAEPL
jgi:ketosteroid isomerase-like protein